MKILNSIRETIAISAIITTFSVSVAFAEDVTLTFVGPQAPSSMEPVIAAFEAANPTVKVNYESIPFKDLNSVLQARVGAGDPNPDVYTADQPRIAALVDRSMLLDLSPYVDKIEGVIQSSVDASTVDGKLYALPISTSSQITYYNKKLLDNAGIDHPSINPSGRMTWEEMRANGEKSKAAGSDFGFMWDQINRYYQLQPLAESAGGGSGIILEESKVDVTNDGWIKAMTFYASTFADGLAPRGVQPGQTKDVFANGNIAYFVGGP
ncbi:MAG: ABC transporter substrate-binding protein, partial [Pseudomonadales bacterium]